MTRIDTDNKMNQLNAKSTEAGRNFNSVTNAIKEIGRERAALETKSEFLERFLTYRNAPGDVSRKLFVDYVCALWKNSEERRVQVDSSPLNISAEQIRAGLSPDLKSLLIARGVPEIFFKNAMKGGVVGVFPTVTRVSPSPGEAIATIEKQANSLNVVKIVHFFDGTTYQVPPEIALAVHTNPLCAPH
jgi:hypothetical protein